MPDPASVDADAWRDYWLNWPLSAWAGRLRGTSTGWFRIDGRRFVPTFRVATDVGETFDAMVEETRRLPARPVSLHQGGERSALEAAFRLKVIQAGGRPILMLDRDRNPGLPEGETPFIADDVIYTGNFVKIALNVAHHAGALRQRPGRLAAVLVRR